MKTSLYPQRLILSLAAVFFAGAIGSHASARVSIDFEVDEEFLIDSAIESYSGWASMGEGGGVITNEDGLTGDQSLRIDPGVPAMEIRYQAAGIPQSGIRFIEIGLRPVVGPPEEVQNSVNLWGSLMGFVSGRNGHIDILPEGCDPEESIPTEAQVDLMGESDRWLYLTIRQDLDAGVWDLFVDGQPASINLPMGQPETSDFLAVVGNETGSMFLDRVTLGTENPLFVDSDGDGMPDAYEIAHRLNPNVDDRNGDRDGDGISNISEYLAGTSPSIAGHEVGSQTLYVDNRIGDDANSGSVSYRCKGDGPMRSIKAAMVAAKSGAVIVVLPGTGVYYEGSRSANGKRITIRIVKPIIIK